MGDDCCSAKWLSESRKARSYERLSVLLGWDMIAIPKDTPAETIAAMIADEAAIIVINIKTTAIRIIP